MAGKRKPCTCQDNINFNATCYGEMHWGDGTIKHGHYLGFLATEYALLKRYNQDFTGTVNELYYAMKSNRFPYKKISYLKFPTNEKKM